MKYENYSSYAISSHLGIIVFMLFLFIIVIDYSFLRVLYIV